MKTLSHFDIDLPEASIPEFNHHPELAACFKNPKQYEKGMVQIAEARTNFQSDNTPFNVNVVMDKTETTVIEKALITNVNELCDTVLRATDDLSDLIVFISVRQDCFDQKRWTFVSTMWRDKRGNKP